MKTFSRLLFFFVLAVYSTNGYGGPLARKVKTDAGYISGYSSEGVSIFKGIPFAAPPVGDLRWKAPREAAMWKGIRECLNSGGKF